jgi:hypothetical protein
MLGVGLQRVWCAGCCCSCCCWREPGHLAGTEVNQDPEPGAWGLGLQGSRSLPQPLSGPSIVINPRARTPPPRSSLPPLHITPSTTIPPFFFHFRPSRLLAIQNLTFLFPQGSSSIDAPFAFLHLSLIPLALEKLHPPKRQFCPKSNDRRRANQSPLQADPGQPTSQSTHQPT